MSATSAASRPRGPSGLAAWLALLRLRLSPAPGRLGNTIRITVLVLVAVTVSQTLRIPEAALSAYIVLFVSRDDAASTVLTAAIAGIAVCLALLATLVVFSLSLAEPALRLPLIAAATFVAMFLSRTCTLGAPAFAAGFIIAYGLTLGDQVLPLSLMPGSTANTAEFALPEAAFMPPEEALVHFILWLGVAVALPVGLVIAANLLTGRDPAVQLRAATAAGFDAAADACAGHDASWPMLERQALEGPGGLLKLHHLASLLKRRPARARPTPELIRLMARLNLLLLAWRRVAMPGDAPLLRARASTLCRRVAACCRGAPNSASNPATNPATNPASDPARAGPPETDAAMRLALRPLAVELATTLEAIAAAAKPVAPSTNQTGTVASAPRRLLATDAFSNPAHVQFAFKVTLAVMLCYLGTALADWPGIHTCMITCFFVSLGTVGETIHKATLRIIGCLIGAALGIATILLLMPAMTDLGDLLLVLAAVTLLAAWIGSGSPRIAYAGWQIAIAFYLCVLQGFGPTLDMQTARDRVIGIVIGNIVVFVVFTTIWPVPVAAAVRAALATGLAELGRLLGAAPAGGSTIAAAPRAQATSAFQQAIAGARDLLANDAYEGAAARPPFDTTLVAQVQALIVPAGVIAQLADAPHHAALSEQQRRADTAYRTAMAEWLLRAAAWLRHRTAENRPGPLPPPPPAGPDDGDAFAIRQQWYGMFAHDLCRILDRVRAMEPAGAGTASGSSAERSVLGPA